MDDFSAGNVVLDGNDRLIIITSIKFIEPELNSRFKFEPYKYVNYKDYKGRWSGGFKAVGHYTKEPCTCWYNAAFRFYTQSCADEDCEICKGTGDMEVYNYGLNDCKFLANNVDEYRIMKLESKIDKAKKTLEKLKSGRG